MARLHHVYLSPPDTTGLTQPLDQINQVLHYYCSVSTKKWARYQQSKLLAQRMREVRADLGDDEINLEDAVDGDGDDDDDEGGSDDDGDGGDDSAEEGRRRGAGEGAKKSLSKRDFLLFLGTRGRASVRKRASSAPSSAAASPRAASTSA